MQTLGTTSWLKSEGATKRNAASRVITNETKQGEKRDQMLLVSEDGDADGDVAVRSNGEGRGMRDGDGRGSGWMLRWEAR